MEDKTTDELKVLAYDKGMLIMQLQEQLSEINKEIQRRALEERKDD